MKGTYRIKDPDGVEGPEDGRYSQTTAPPTHTYHKPVHKTVTEKKVKKSKAAIACINNKHKRIIVKIVKVVYGLISVTIIVSTLFLIGLCAIGAIVFRTYDHNGASRVASMFVVAFTAAVHVLLGVYGVLTAISTSKRPIHKVSVTVIILAIMLLVLTVFTIHMSPVDEELVLDGLHKTFRLAGLNSPRNAKHWDDTQNQLECCGIIGPEDYASRDARSAPAVPASCCVSYDPGLSEYAQQRMLDLCRRQSTYYVQGCREPVVDACVQASEMVYGVGVIVVVFCFVQGSLGILVSNMMTRWKKHMEAPSGPDVVQSA